MYLGVRKEKIKDDKREGEKIQAKTSTKQRTSLLPSHHETPAPRREHR